MNCKQRDRKAYYLAQEFLLRKKDKGITKEVLDEYMQDKHRPDSISGIYHQLLQSAQNANMLSGVIGKFIGGVRNLSPILFDFDPGRVLKEYHNWEEVLDQIEARLMQRKKCAREKGSLWPRYCRSILSSAAFLNRFPTASDFYAWCDSIISKQSSNSELPNQIRKNVFGFGKALACDFLKELGYSDYGKPDVHIKDIFTGIDFCNEEANQDTLLATINRIALNVGISSYNVDKTFWLIGSGYFYLHKNEIGKNGRIGSMKAEFIPYAKETLQEDG